jgi:hypothetical protein
VIADAFTGVAVTLRARRATFAVTSLVIAVLSLLLPLLLLSLARAPVDFFTFNPWLRRLPEYLASPAHTAWTKVEKLTGLALFWFSADSPFGGTEWGFAVDLRDLARIVVTSLLVGLYFALWRQRRAMTRPGAVSLAPGSRPGAVSLAPGSRPGSGSGAAGGLGGALASVIGLSTGPCSVVGCGAPVLPVVGLAFVGLSSGTLKLLSSLSFVATITILAVLIVATAYLAWSVGAARRRAPAAPSPGRNAPLSAPSESSSA